MSGLSKIWSNLRGLPRNVKHSIIRHGAPSSDRTRAQTVFSNFFLHFQSTRVHKHSLKASTTWGLGVMTLALFFILCATGVLLMIYYKPSTAEAYDSMKDIIYVVPVGRMMRNIHRWAAHGMVIAALVHMARVFYTGSYHGPRSFNWVLGMILLVLTMALSFTGYLLPWDQLAFWAITIGSNIAQSPRELTEALGITESLDIGGAAKHLLLGANSVGQEALIRFYVLHVIVLPAFVLVITGVHFWRIRKDGGLNRPEGIDRLYGPDQRHGRGIIFPQDGSKTYGLMAVVKGKSPVVGRGPEHTVASWPHLFYAELLPVVFITVVMLALGYFLDGPLKEIANPSVPENPAKAPWYFLALQELVSYSAFAGGIAIPTIVVFGLMCIPYLDREGDYNGVWFAGSRGKRIALASALFSGAFVVFSLWFTVTQGWLRDWDHDIPGWVIMLINPGTVYVVVYAAWSLLTVWRTGSTRMGAIALFTCFAISFVVLTYFATFMRGPNWDFFWSSADWPAH